QRSRRASYGPRDSTRDRSWTAASRPGAARRSGSAAAEPDRAQHASAEPLDRVAGGFEGGDERLAMLGVAQRERQLDLGVAQGERDALAAVLDLDDVAPLLRDELEQLDQLARPVRHARPQREVAAGHGEPVAHHLDQERRIDVPARQQREHRPLTADPPGEERRERGGAGAL